MGRAYADLPLHYGKVPQWLAERMSRLGVAITEAVVTEYGRAEFLRRMGDPHWFQALGCVMGMDWHSSGITTSVMGALKRSVNERSSELGIYLCGGRGKYSLRTPDELRQIAMRTGLDGASLVRCSKLAAKVDNTAVQDGYQLYLHSFILTADGHWAVIQQGMNSATRMARRYHWVSENVGSFVNEPHASVCGKNHGEILNLTDGSADSTRSSFVSLTRENPDKMLREAALILPSHHEVRKTDVNMKRLGAALVLAHEHNVKDFESLLLLEGVGPRTVQALTLVSEVIHGTPSRFRDPARFAFALGGKDGHPFPVPTKVYDKTINVLETSLRQAKIGNKDKADSLKRLHKMALRIEKGFFPDDFFDAHIAKERAESYKHGGRTVFGKAKKPETRPDSVQLSLWK
ncbi:MAG: DUF763 domain-containing protein [Alistipes sp.]|nr:DUF763 domain-containing protein [Alistipes sp.]